MSNQEDWIDRNNKLMVEWAFNYLKKRGFINQRSLLTSTDISHLYNAMRQLPDPAKMKAAWAQKKFRDKRNGRKSYNFEMSTQVKGHLKFLAKQIDRPIKETLELLITNEYRYQKQIKDLEKQQRNASLTPGGTKPV